MEPVGAVGETAGYDAAGNYSSVVDNARKFLGKVTKGSVASGVAEQSHS